MDELLLLTHKTHHHITLTPGALMTPLDFSIESTCKEAAILSGLRREWRPHKVEPFGLEIIRAQQLKVAARR